MVRRGFYYEIYHVDIIMWEFLPKKMRGNVCYLGSEDVKPTTRDVGCSLNDEALDDIGQRDDSLEFIVHLASDP